jgi:hypothetical protein
MPYTVALPDGRTVEFPDSVPPEKAAEILRQQFPPPSAGFSFRDLLTSFGQGAVGSTKALTDVAGAENVASQQLEKAGEALQQRLSPARQAELRRQQERAKKAEESGSTLEEIKAAAQSVAEAPLQSTAQALGSFVPYIPTMFLGPAAATLGLGARATAAATSVARAAPAAIGTAQGAGAVKGAIYERVYEAERQDGVPEEQARAKAGAAQDYFGKNIDQILLGAGAGYVAGRFGAERLLTPGAAEAAGRTALGRIGTAVATDVPTEAFQGGQERLASNLALQREGRDVSAFQGVAGQAAQEGIMGALGAVPVAAIRGPGDTRVKEEQDRRAEESARQQAEADAEAARQAAFRQSPEYIDDLEKRFAQIKATEQQLEAATKGKVDKNDLLAVEARRRAKEALEEFRKSDDYKNTLEEYTQAFDVLRPRILERQRVARVGAAPEGAQLDVFGEPAGVQDLSVPGQIKSLEDYISSFDKPLKAAEKAGDTNQVALLQQKQNDARQQIAALFPDVGLLAETRQRAQARLEDYQTQIKTITEMPEKTSAEYQQLKQLNDTASQIRSAIEEMDRTQKSAEKYRPTEVIKPVDKTRQLSNLNKKLEKQAALGEDIGATLQKLEELQAVQEQPALFGEEDLREVKARDLGDFIADERERVKALREKLDAERAALQRMATTPQTELTEEVRRRKQEITEEARKTAEQIRQRNQDLVNLEQLQLLQSRLGQQLRGLQAQNKPIPDLLSKRIATIRKDIEGITNKLKAQEPVPEGQRELAPPAEAGEFAPRVTDAELMAQRDRDIEALLDQYLPPALGITETQETLTLQGPEGPREVRLTTLGGERPVTATQIQTVNDQREDLVDAYVSEFVPAVREATTDAERREASRTADDAKNTIVKLTIAEIDLRRRRAGGQLLSEEYRTDLVELTEAALAGRAAAIPGRTANEQIDSLVEEFAKVSPQDAAATPTKLRRVATGVRPAALAGADIPARIAANEKQIKQIRQDLKYAGRPTDPEKVAARDKLVTELQPLVEENAALRAEYNKQQAGQVAPAVEETGEVAEMRKELAGIERALASGMFKGDVVQRMEAARDELQGRIEAAVGPQRPEPKEAEGQRQFLPAAGFPSTALAGRLKPVSAEDLTKARTAVVAATQKIEDIRKATSRVSDMGEQYFREVATTYQQRIEKEAADRARVMGRIKALEKQIETQIKLSDSLPAERQKDNAYLDEAAALRQQLTEAQSSLAAADRRAEAMKDATAEVQRFLNLASLAGVNKTSSLRQGLDQALDRALADKEKKEAALAELQKKQRMYEQQEAARRGIDLGEAEAEKITAGEAEGFVSGRGKALREKPKSKRSWIISKDSKVKVIKPDQTKKLQGAIQNAVSLVGEARREKEAAAEALVAQAPSPQRVAELKESLAKLTAQVNAYYNAAQAADLQREIDKLKETLATLTVAPKIANVAEQYDKASTATKGLPAPERVAQMMFEKSTAEQKAARQLQAAEQTVAAANAKYDASQKALKQAETKLARLKDPKKIQGVKLQIGNLIGSAPKLRDDIQNALYTQSEAEKNYMAARLERLLLNQQMGEHAKREAANITAQLAGAADTVTNLQKQLDIATANEAEMRKKLDSSSVALEKTEADAEAARQAARSAERLAQEKAREDALDAAKAAQDRVRAMQSGLGLPGIRVERDTAGKLMTAAQADIKKRLATAETNLSKAMRSGNTEAIKAATKAVQDTTTELDQVYGKAPVARTEVGVAREAEIEDVFQPAPVEGMRLPSRREGPAVRYVRGGSKAIMQSGVTKLRAAGLSQESANAISLYVKKNQIKGAKTAEDKAKRAEEFAALTREMSDEQVNAMVAEGQRLMGLGPTAELIAKRAALQDALAAVTKAEQDVRDAKTNVTKELANDELELARQREQRADNAYEQAKTLYEMSQIKAAKKAEKETVESFFDEAEAVAPSRLSSAIDQDLVPMVYTTDTRTESSPAVREAILDGRLLDALDRLAVEGANDLIRQNARDLRSLVMRTKIIIDPNLIIKGEAVPAAYSPKLNAVIFRPDAITDEDIIHEVTHAATLRVLRMPDAELTSRQRNAKKELEAIFAQVSKDKALVGQYGLKNVDEFVSEVQSNVDFRAAIDQKPWYKRLWHAIMRLFSRAPIEAVSDRASRMVRELYLPSKKIETATDVVPSVFRATAAPSSIMGRPAGTLATLQGNFFGLSGRVQYIDRLAAPEKAFVEAQKTGALSSLEAETAQYFMRLGDMVTQAAGQFITTGPVRIVKDTFNGQTEERYAADNGGPTLLGMAEFMERASKEGLGDANEVERIVTVKVAGDRANAIPRGWERLMSTDPAKAKAEYNEVIAKLNANPAAKKFVDAAIAEYKAYNDGLMDLAEQTGYISADEAKRLKKTPYIPYYRVENGVVKLYVDRETPMTIGNIKDNPDLQQLLGDNKQILPILTSAVQNTFMLTRMSLHNKATQETTKALEKAGFVSKMGKGAGPGNVSTVHYKYKGEPYFATIDADQFGIPAELIVKGMEGIKTTIPDVVRLLGIPANWLRTFITRLPAYALRQMVRDPLNAAIVGGVDGVPVLNALKQMAKMRAGRNPSADALMRGLVVSSNIYTGNEQDMQRFIEAASTGRGKWSKFMGGLDQLALQSDAATRTAIYEDGIKKGLSERQAQFRAMESQNFSRRGLSPSMQVMSTLVPFFNAQIQGLDALYRSFRGDMPFSEKLDIQKKIISRGTLLMVTALSYAFLMRDNEEYKKATPEERYANFFVPLPGTKDMLKIPIPYEVGLLFKALPEAVLDSILGDTKAEEAAKGIGKLLMQSAPGVLPAAGKPLIEAAYGQTLLGPIESEREKQLPTAQRFRETTPEVLKTLGAFTGEVGISPLMLEHLARGYTSSLGISALRILDPVLGDATEGEKASQSLNKLPFIGGLFQTGDGRFLIERAYSRMEEIVQAEEGYKDLEKRGKRAEAQAFAQRNADLLAATDMAGMFRQRSGQMFADERAIRAEPTLTKAQKDALLEKIKAAQNEEARQFYAASERSTRPQPQP